MDLDIDPPDVLDTAITLEPTKASVLVGTRYTIEFLAPIRASLSSRNLDTPQVQAFVHRSFIKTKAMAHVLALILA